MKNNNYDKNLKKLKRLFLQNANESALEEVTYNKESYIINEGSTITDFIFVLNGKIKITQNYENGKTLLLQFIDGFSILGDIEYYLKEDAYSSVQAITEVKAIKVSNTYIENNYKNDTNFLENILIQMGQKILHTNNKSSLNLIYPLETRLASYLLGLSINRKVSIPKLSDVSAHLGTSYRHLHRVLKQFKEEKIIKKLNKEIIILNQEKLNQIGRGNIYERNNDFVVKD